MRVVAVIAACLMAAPAMADGLFYNSTGFKAYEYGLPPGADPKGRVLTFQEIDRNHDHVWDPVEIAKAFGPAAYDAALSFDGNGDGIVTLLEFRAFDDRRTGGPDGILWERVRG